MLADSKVSSQMNSHGWNHLPEHIMWAVWQKGSCIWAFRNKIWVYITIQQSNVEACWKMWSHTLWLSLSHSLTLSGSLSDSPWVSLALFGSPNLLTKSLLGSLGPSRGPQPNLYNKVLVQFFAALLRFVNFYRFGQSYCGPQWDTIFCWIRHTLDISCGAQWDTAHPIVYLVTLRGFPVSQSGLRGRFLLAVGELGISATRDIRRSCLGDVIHKYQTNHSLQDTLNLGRW